MPQKKLQKDSNYNKYDLDGDGIVTDEELAKASEIYPHNTPVLKESLYYRKIFETHYPNREKLIDHFWLPKWCGNMMDPSARDLQFYNQKKKSDQVEISCP